MAKRKAPKKNQHGELNREEFYKLWNKYRKRDGLKPIVVKLSFKRYV